MEQNVKMSMDEFKVISEFIYEKTGIHFSESRIYLLESRLARRLADNNCRSFMEYATYLKYNDKNSKELSLLFDSITTNETSFFRDKFQLTAFEKMILPGVIAQKKKAGKISLKIWSAACSTGEEPYTLGIIAKQNHDLLRSFKIEIIASDISDKVLASARKGEYSSYALRNTQQEFIDKYFVQKDMLYSISPSVRDYVKFLRLNLYESFQIGIMIKEVDVVFCRNVLIYFDNDAKKRVISSIYDVLSPNGYLILGHSESLHNISRAFKLLTFDKTIVYQKI